MDAKESISILSENVKQLRDMLQNRENDCTILDKAQTLLDTMDEELRWLQDCIDSNEKEARTQDSMKDIGETVINNAEKPVTEEGSQSVSRVSIIRKEVKIAFKEVLENMAESLKEL